MIRRLLGRVFDFWMARSSTLRFLYFSMKHRELPKLDVLSNLRHWNRWFKAHDYSAKGDLERASQIWTRVLKDLYSKEGLNSRVYFPPYFAKEYWDAFGHRAIMATVLAAQDFDLVPKGKRIVKVPRQDLGHPLLRSLSDKLEVQVETAKSEGIFPKDWTRYERLEVIKGQGTFIEIYELIDAVFRLAKVSESNPLVALPQDYLEQSAEALARYGFDVNNWFVGLHVRDDGLGPGRRNQSIRTYVPAIQEIIARGGQVLRIGDPKMPPLEPVQGVLDLTQKQGGGQEYHLFALARARFFMGTSSGPASYPSLFGVPTLFTNTTSIGRNTLAASEHSFYVPKLLFGDTRVLTFSEQMRTSEAFGELSQSDLGQLGLHLRSNTPDQIWMAVCEMFDRLEGRFSPDVANDKLIEQVRSNYSFASSGQMSHSFMLDNPDWLA